jgi:hypothetical protein
VLRAAAWRIERDEDGLRRGVDEAVPAARFLRLDKRKSPI